MAARNKGIQDAGAPLIVDHFHRRVTVPSTERVIGVVGDHLSEQVTFQIARHIDNHDMLEGCPIKYVAWRNVNGETGTDELTVVKEGSENEPMILGWTIRDRVAIAKGLVDFSLHFEKRDPVTNQKQYSWGTFKCTECEILDSVNSAPGAYEAIYIDGETLVFADYTPVVDGYINIETAIVPKDTVELTTEGKHDVARYAYAEVKSLYEEPSINTERVAEGVRITATANGLETQRTLRLVDFIRTSMVRLIHQGRGFVRYQTVDTDGSIKTTTIDLSKETVAYLTPITGSTMAFTTPDNKAAKVTTQDLTDLQTTESALGGAIVSTLITVPATEGTDAYQITME